MLEEAKYIDEIWNRYNEYMLGNIKNDFYETRVYNKENNMNKLLKTVAMFISAIILTVGVVYAGIAIYNNYIKHSIYSEYSMNASKSWVKENMKIVEGDKYSYYTIITNYEDYLKYKEKFNDMNNLKEVDFEENFIILISTRITNISKISIVNISEDENTLYIDLNRDNSNNKAKTLHTLIFSKEQYKENIKVRRVYEKIKETNISLEDLPKDYSIEQAISDGCIVLNEGKLVSENEKKIYEFIEKSNKGEECFIRVVEYFDNNIKFKVQDVHYKDGIYLYALKQNDGIIKYKDDKYTEIKLDESGDRKILLLYNQEDLNEIKFILEI